MHISEETHVRSVPIVSAGERRNVLMHNKEERGEERVERDGEGK